MYLVGIHAEAFREFCFGIGIPEQDLELFFFSKTPPSGLCGGKKEKKKNCMLEISQSR